MTTLNKINETKIGLIPENYSMLESQQINQDRDKKISKVTFDELKEEDSYL